MVTIKQEKSVFMIILIIYRRRQAFLSPQDTGRFFFITNIAFWIENTKFNFFVSVANIKVTFKISHLVCLRLLRQERSQDDRHQWPATTRLILIMPAPDHGQSLITEVNRKLLVSIYLAVSPGLDTWYCLTARNSRRIFLVIRCCYVDLTQRSFEIIFIL